MSFINWGHEDQEQKNLRRAMEERELFEQALQLAYARSNGSLAGAAAGSGQSAGGNINGTDVYYLRSNEAEPWDEQDNPNEMTAVFGQNWRSAYFETLDFNEVFSTSTKYVFVDGGDVFDLLFKQFIEERSSQLQSWVRKGGNLFLNCAGQETLSYDLGFGGIIMTRPSGNLYNSVIISSGQENHPIFQGPGSTGAAWNGGSFAHAKLESNFTSLIETPNGEVVLVEKEIGNGKLMIGTMTITGFHSPQPQASNLRKNIHSYLSGQTYSLPLNLEEGETVDSAQRGPSSKSQS